MVALDTRRIGWRSPNRDGSSGFELERNGHFWPMAEIAFLAFDFRSSAGSGRSSHFDSAVPDLTLATHSRSVRDTPKPDPLIVGGEGREMFPRKHFGVDYSHAIEAIQFLEHKDRQSL
jgi:hypothetical protein